MQRAANPLRSRFFSFWVVRKLATVNSAPSKSYQTGVTWGRPSGRTVARAATCGWLRKVLTSADIGAGILTPGDGSARILSRSRRGRQTIGLARSRRGATYNGPQKRPPTKREV